MMISAVLPSLESTSAKKSSKHPFHDRREAKRVAIMRAATSVFRQVGFQAANMIQIARAAGMTKSNLYNYFEDKESLLFFCHDHSMDRLLQILSKVNHSAAPPDVKLRRLATGFIHWIVDRVDSETLALDLRELSPEHLRKIITKRKQLDRGMRKIISQGMKSGVFRPVDPKLFSFSIWGSLNWIPRWFRAEGPADAAEISDAFVTFFFSGLLSKRQRD